MMRLFNNDATEGAEISECGRYRYRLWRRWGDGPSVLWIMLNPSTADASIDDPTIRRCIGFAKTWGHAGIRVVNLFALRATHPAELITAHEPGGFDNSDVIVQELEHHDGPVVAAWGATAWMVPRVDVLVDWVAEAADLFGIELQCLGTTKAGHPRHPLYVAGATPLVPFRWQAAA